MKIKGFLFLLLAMMIGVSSSATNYYINSQSGSDTNDGKSKHRPFKTAIPLRAISLQPGDSILFATGLRYTGMLSLSDVNGTQDRPIVISNYRFRSDTTKPVLDAGNDLNTIHLKNTSHIQVTQLELTAMTPYGKSETGKAELRCGILVETTKEEIFQNIVLKHLVVHDVYYNEPGFKRSAAETKSANGTQSYGWGIRFINQSKKGVMKQLSVSFCKVYNVSHTGIKITAPAEGIKGMEVNNNEVFDTGGPGMQFSGVNDGHIHHNNIHHSGSIKDTRNWGRGSGLWTWSCSDILIEHNRFEYANGPGDSAGVHIDFNCSHVVVQYNFSANNAGGFCEILGNNYNCSYRYNISVNDGYRVKGKDGAFQEGKIFWLSGYQGDKQKPTGPFNSYFYNNTMYVGSGIVPKVAISATASGILIMNNIFYFEDSAVMVAGDQFKTDANLLQSGNTIFNNNLFLYAHNWPAAFPIQDARPLIGDPQFRKKAGFALVDYHPRNTIMIKDKGMVIPKIPGDNVGIKIGLDMAVDILGNKIKGKPDIGAIELQ